MGVSKAISGKYGTVKVAGSSIVEIKNWKLSTKTNVPKWGSNLSDGWKTGVAGVRDGSGSFDLLLQEPDASAGPLQDGDMVVLQLHIDNSGANYYGCTAIVEQSDVECNIDTGDPVSIGYTFQSIGAVTFNGTAGRTGGSGFGSSSGT